MVVVVVVVAGSSQQCSCTGTGMPRSPVEALAEGEGGVSHTGVVPEMGSCVDSRASPSRGIPRTGLSIP